VDDGTVGLYQAQGGIAPAARCNRTHQALARAHGATLLDNTPATNVRALPAGMEVTTPDATYRCRKLVVTADAWTNRVLAPLGVRIPLTSTQEQVAYYAAPNLDDFRPDRFPSWIWYDVPCFYGLAVYGEERGVKVAQDIGGAEITPETRTFEPNQRTLERVGAFMRQHMPGAIGPIVSLKTCIYTMTPDRDFVIDTLSDYPRVAVGLGAAHGFKFASIIGRVLSDLAIDGRSDYSAPKFAASRAILRKDNPPRIFQSNLDKNKLPVLV
jgi:sarcosine oxidase